MTVHGRNRTSHPDGQVHRERPRDATHRSPVVHDRPALPGQPARDSPLSIDVAIVSHGDRARTGDPRSAAGAPFAIEIRVRGCVPGGGLRPMVWRFARELGVTGEVLNDGDGVLIRARGEPGALAAFLSRLSQDLPPLARVDAVEPRAFLGAPAGDRHVAGERGSRRSQIAADAAICDACAADVCDPFGRRYRYPFTACPHCGPRLSIMTGVPYARAATTLAGFALCPPCAAEYADPGDRRFRAEATGCRACGPRARLVRYDGRAASFAAFSLLDDPDAVAGLLTAGEIVAIKGLGGYHLACDATLPAAVARLRAATQRAARPLPVMARSLDVIRRYCAVDAAEAAALAGPQAPIVVLDAVGPEALPDLIAPGLATLGFLLPTTPLHHLILRRFDRPVVMTSGNRSGEPQATDDADAARRLAGIATYALVHDRPIASRVEDSVVRRADGAIRVVRRARGYCPASIKLPAGFARAPEVLAMGGDRHAAFCLIRRGEAILSQHLGDLADPAALHDYRAELARYAALFAHTPSALAIDRDPELVTSALARGHAATAGLPIAVVQHHHASVAACLAENGHALAAPPVLGVVLDGLGLGDDGALWGGEFLLADYRRAERLGSCKPVAMLGGERAAREPWRNLYAHLVAELGWPALTLSFAELPLHARLAGKPRALLDGMLASGRQAPVASSCGRLFEAVAAAVGICFERQDYDGEAAARLEAAVDPHALDEGDELAYPFAIPRLPGSTMPYLEPLAMWNAILGDLVRATPVGVIAARFHRGLARAVAQMVSKLARAGDGRRFDTVALSGSCFHNRILLEQCARRLRGDGFVVLSHAQVPSGDGGLALGQAAICAARQLDGGPSCA